jgi:hypothetical protein
MSKPKPKLKRLRLEQFANDFIDRYKHIVDEFIDDLDVMNNVVYDDGSDDEQIENRKQVRIFLIDRLTTHLKNR